MISGIGKYLFFVLLVGVVTIAIFPPSVWAIDFEDIRYKMKNMTSIAWDDYAKFLKGQEICWEGWVSDVKEQWSGGFKILIDMDAPGSFSVSDVYLEDLTKNIACQFYKGQKVSFSGRIQSVINVFGSCAVTIKNATISTKK